MAFQDTYNINQLVNIAELEVFSAIDELLARDTEICRCQVCMLDVAALALNRMPSVYRVTPYTPNPPGALSVMWDDELSDLREIAERAVAEAAEQVRASPHH